MNIDDTLQSKYLTKKDIDQNGRGTLATITSIIMENVAPENKHEEIKPVIMFAELPKGFVCGAKVNKEAIKSIVGSSETAHWIGHKIVLYHDPNVMNLKGERVGGIRIRAPRNQTAAQQQPQQSATSWQRAQPAQTPPPENSNDDY
jgi:hypothetical protein